MCFPSRETSVDQFLQGMVDLLHSDKRGGVREASDSDWLEINGNPTIPHVQSIRAPPAHIAFHAKKDSMLGITNKNVSRRYLEKLQRERERNQEVLTECIDNLPITIKQLVYPEKPQTKEPSGFGNISANASRETKFRVGRSSNFWHESDDQWVKEQRNPSNPDTVSNLNSKDHNSGRNVVRDKSHHSKSSTDGAFINKDFVHYPGFQGSSGQAQSLKHKFGRKKSSVNSDSSTKQAPVKFKPKGYGSLYDELEFERRYKKVFDLNKHIHFVHSNYLSGQRLIKRTKLPPIGYNPSIHSDPMDTGDVFAIMSVQKYNHPNEFEKTRMPLSNPGSAIRKSDGLLDRRPSNRPRLEVSQSLETPIGFVPGTIPNTGSSPFDGVNGSSNEMTRENLFRLQNMLQEVKSQPYTARTDTERLHDSPRKINGRLKADEEKGKGRKRRSVNPGSVRSTTVGSEITEAEPFNIRVCVAIRPPKDTETPEECSEDSRNSSPSSSQRDGTPHKRSVMDADNYPEELRDSFEEREMYPTKIDNIGVNVQGGSSTLDTTIEPTHVSITTNEYGFETRKVQYPPDFVIENSVSIVKDHVVNNQENHVDGGSIDEHMVSDTEDHVTNE